MKHTSADELSPSLTHEEKRRYFKYLLENNNNKNILIITLDKKVQDLLKNNFHSGNMKFKINFEVERLKMLQCIDVKELNIKNK